MHFDSLKKRLNFNHNISLVSDSLRLLPFEVLSLFGCKNRFIFFCTLFFISLSFHENRKQMILSFANIKTHLLTVLIGSQETVERQKKQKLTISAHWLEFYFYFENILILVPL